MIDTASLLELARRVVSEAAALLAHVDDGGRIVGRDLNEREVKIAADSILNDALIASLGSSGLPVLSEESPPVELTESASYWILDPLDGSYNYSRELGPSMISLALFSGGRVAFGVLHDVSDGSEYWGGPEFGAFRDGKPISVSSERLLTRSVLCTGYPARFAVDDDSAMAPHTARIRRFGKIRMVGSATAALTRVARGSAEAYVESGIMSWDVAAGIALVAGAGGAVIADFSSPYEPMFVAATNGSVDFGG